MSQSQSEQQGCLWLINMRNWHCNASGKRDRDSGGVWESREKIEVLNWNRYWEIACVIVRPASPCGHALAAEMGPREDCALLSLAAERCRAEFFLAAVGSETPHAHPYHLADITRIPLRL